MKWALSVRIARPPGQGYARQPHCASEYGPEPLVPRKRRTPSFLGEEYPKQQADDCQACNCQYVGSDHRSCTSPTEPSVLDEHRRDWSSEDEQRRGELPRASGSDMEGANSRLATLPAAM